MPPVDFYTLSKVFWVLVAPANLMALCLGIAFLARLKESWRMFGLFFSTAILILLVFGVLPTGTNLLAYVEGQYSRPREMPDHVTGIIVLGGAVDPSVSSVRGIPVINDGVERLLDGVRLARQYPDAKPIFSGGSALWIQNKNTEAVVTALFLKDYPDIASRAQYEDKSRNTWQNAIYSREKFSPGPDDKWILVTSAYHMPRAMYIFQATGWKNVTAWPTDYRTNGKFDMVPHDLDILGNFYRSHLAVRELIGQIAYRVREKL